ncbi:hypothetical protein CXB51_014303 [Gossypium anomalum]|uniref:adenine phosphoribosyltransferase n=1 Tax=Gossypium anomalum TaxID=47600 RepID=A0A8J5Z4F6_9ROSI|nr:hypothetical protein CXB51_014303 [Gossypium anomalum]
MVEMFAAENGLKGDPRLQAISNAIRVVPHFPKQGIMFQDITTLLLDHKAFKNTVDIFVDRYKDMDISVVAGVEARGFMFGPTIALAIGANDCLEMHVGSVEAGERAIVIDDLVATERVGAEVVECACVIGLREVKGQRRLNGKPLFILVEPREIDSC